MDDRDALHLGHLLDAAKKAHAKVSRVDRAAFDADENLQLAVTLLIQRVGESAHRLSAEARNEIEDVPWQDVIGMRHRLVHDYMHVDLDIVWNTAMYDLPPLIAAVERPMET